MPVCDECGTEYETLKNTCRYCDGEFCPDHHLPEKHDCPGLDDLNVGTRHFESAVGDGPTGSPRTIGELEEEDHEDDGPNVLEDVRTHGGSGRDQSDAGFASSPDVNPDGTLEESEVEAVTENFVSEEPDESEHPYAYILIYVITGIVVLVLQFGFGVDVVALLPGL